MGLAGGRHGLASCGHKSLSWDVFRTFSTWNIVNRWPENLPYIMLCERETERLSKYFSEYELLKKHAENDLEKKFVETRGCAVSDPRDKVYAVLPLVSQVK